METQDHAPPRATKGRPGSSRPHRRPGRGGRPSWLGPLLTAVGLVAVLAVVFVGFRLARAGTVLPGTTLAGIDVGGLDAAELEVVARELDADRRGREITVTRDEDALESTAAEMGYAIDVPATVERVMARGRQSNPLIAFRDQVRAGFSPAAVPPVETFDTAAFETWLDTAADALSLPPIEGDVVVNGGLVEIVEPSPGETIDVPRLRELALGALDAGGDTTFEVPTVVAAPAISRAQLDALAAAAQRAVNAPVTLTRGEVRLTFTGAQIGELLDVSVQAVGGASPAPTGGAPTTTDPTARPDDGTVADLALGIDADAFLAAIPADLFGQLAAQPVDTTFEVSGESISLVPGQDGFAFDAEVAADQLLEVATGTGPRIVELDGERTEPEFSSADAEALGIVEQVSTFTTQHPCCQSRVTNIQRMADLVRGTIVRPGETFSLNGHVGRRTTDNGFVGGGAISGGEFVEQIGGGVSQFTTTMFNTIFFGGYDIVEFKPHSYYISRYPEGREATLNFDPPVDLKFTNDSPHGIYIHTSYTDTSITVTFFSTEYAEVDTTTGARYGFREPEEERVETDELPAGEERVAQSGRQGFSVDFTRQLRYADGRAATENYTTVYLPEPRVIEVGTGEADAQPTPTPEPTEEGPDPAPTEQPGDDEDGDDSDEPSEPPAPTAAPSPAQESP